MPKRTFYALNNNAGAFTDIPATCPCRRVQIVEGADPAVAPVGLQYKTNENGDNFATTIISPAGDGRNPTVELGNKVAAEGGTFGTVLGYPANPSGGATRAADVLAKIRSNTAAASKVLVIEYE